MSIPALLSEKAKPSTFFFFDVSQIGSEFVERSILFFTSCSRRMVQPSLILASDRLRWEIAERNVAL